MQCSGCIWVIIVEGVGCWPFTGTKPNETQVPAYLMHLKHFAFSGLNSLKSDQFDAGTSPQKCAIKKAFVNVKFDEKKRQLVIWSGHDSF